MQVLKLEEIVKIIKEKRKALGYSRDKVAEYLGISYRAYSSIENGTNEIRASYLIKLIEFLEIDNVMIDQSPKKEVPPPKVESLDDLAKVLLKEINRLHERLDENSKKS